MLVLARKKGESIILKTKDGTTVSIRVEAISSNRVKIAIEAPEQVSILRNELVGGKEKA